MSVKPSGNGGTKYWRNLENVGTVTRIGSLYIWVHWSDMTIPDGEYGHYPTDLRDADEV